MVVRLGAAIGVAAIMVVYSSYSHARTVDQNQNKPNATAASHVIVGVASEYNPFRPGYREGGAETASGERYDPEAWTAAIQTDLRAMFGGVRIWQGLSAGLCARRKRTQEGHRQNQ
jgi:rare lipoprotein A